MNNKIKSYNLYVVNVRFHLKVLVLNFAFPLISQNGGVTILQRSLMCEYCLKQERTVSINILTENDIGFHNMVIYALFNCMRFVWDFAYFSVMNSEFANKLALHILLL